MPPPAGYNAARMIPLHDDNPTVITPVLTITFIVTCVLVFVWQLSLGDNLERMILALGVIPATVVGNATLAPELQLIPPWLTVFTSMFMHGGWMHLIGNMLYLWIFGNNVEDAMGHLRFIIFYILCGIAAAAGQVFQNPDSMVPMIGASGAISGVLGAYLLLYPHARILVLLPLGFYAQLIRIPASWVLGFWFFIQVLSSMLFGPQQGGVAWYAHMAGFVTGLLLVTVFKRKKVKLFHNRRGVG